MRILYLAHRIPYPPDKGDKIRSFHQLEYLAARHEVWSAFFIDDPKDEQHVGALESICQRVQAFRLPRWRAAMRGLSHMATGGSLSVGFYDDRRMRDALKTWSRITTFDAALVFSSSMGPYSHDIRADRKVLDLCDWDSLKWKARAERSRPPHSWLFDLEAQRLADSEADCVASFHACTVVTQAEVDAIELPDLRRRVHVVGNGVDKLTDVSNPDRKTARIGFVGQMDYWPNVDAVRWFADRVLPRVRREMPGATLEIVGRAPTPEVVSLGSRYDGGITVTGEVPDVQPHLRSFDVSVAPLRVGRGVQNKVLEAMAASKPVVLTSAAAAGIDATDGEHFIVADDETATADRIIRLLRNPRHRDRIGRAARERVLTRYSWDHELAKLENLLNG